MKFANMRIWVIVLLIGFLFILPSCDGGGGDGGGSDSFSQVSLELGETTTIGSALVGVEGSLLFVDIQDDPIDGLEINIPVGAYQEETGFTVSYSPIISHSGDENLDPVTPMIIIDNGGEYADEIMTVKIPVTMEDDYHYMAFYYDEITGGLEGIPEVEHDATSLTIATRHFSKIVINRLSVAVAIATGTIDSGFQVKKDNWQFTNLGTYLYPGLCSGMSISSLYYYTEKKKNLGEPQLFGRYDSGISGFGTDDDLAIKFCSHAQLIDGRSDGRSFDDWKDLNKQKNDAWTYVAFCHSILLTGEPQYVAIFPPGNNVIGHAMVVYKKSGNDLYVADPNLPEDQGVKIEFDWDGQYPITGVFKPFRSQWTTGTALMNFTEISYFGKTAIADWGKLKTLWNKIDINEVSKDFPDYELKIIEKDATGTEKESTLTDGYKTTNNTIKVRVETSDFAPRLRAFYAYSTVINNETEIVEITLIPGDNNIGFLIEAELDSDITNKKEWFWTDFKYLNIKLEEDTPDPPDPQGESSIIVKNTYDEKVLVNIYIWTGEWWKDHYGAITLEPGETTTKQVSEAGEYKIIVRGYALNPQEWRWQPTIDLSEQEYTYDFFATQDCNFAKFTVTNQTQYDFWCRFECDREVEGCESVSSIYLDENEADDVYLVPGIFYTLSVHASTGVPNCKGDECYVCWSDTFILDCQGNKAILSGSGTPCD